MVVVDDFDVDVVPDVVDPEAVDPEAVDPDVVDVDDGAVSVVEPEASVDGGLPEDEDPSGVRSWASASASCVVSGTV